MTARTIQVTDRILASCNTRQFYWLEEDEEPIPLLENAAAAAHNMLILGYDSGKDQINLYDNAQFKELGVNGYYIASFYQDRLWNPHMNPSLSFIYNGEKYSAGELFQSDALNGYIEKRYQRMLGSSMYLSGGSFAIDQEAGTMQVTGRILGVPENYHYVWIMSRRKQCPWRITHRFLPAVIPCVSSPITGGTNPSIFIMNPDLRRSE